MMGASFQASLASIRGETTELRACRKVPTDRQTAFHLYIVNIYINIYMYIYIFEFVYLYIYIIQYGSTV